MSLSNEDIFRAQNSINLSIALVAAAFALMAGVLAAFFAVADKIPDSGAGTAITVFTIIAIGLCLASVFFGGRGVSRSIKAVGGASNQLGDAYDGGNFGWQGITGILGTIAVVLMIAFSITIRAHHTEAIGEANSWRPATVALSANLADVERRQAEFVGGIDQISRNLEALGARVVALETPKSTSNVTCSRSEIVACKQRLPRCKSSP